MSFELRLKAAYAVAKTSHFAEQAGLQLKAERLADIVGKQKPPITHAGLQDGFERAIRNGMPREEATRLQQVIYRRGFETLVNDEPTYVAKLSEFQAEIKSLRADLEDPAIFAEIKKLIPKDLRDKLTEAQLDLVVSEVRSYAAEVCTFIDLVLSKALLGTSTGAQRAVGFAQLQAAVDAFMTMQAKVIEPLKGLDPNA